MDHRRTVRPNIGSRMSGRSTSDHGQELDTGTLLLRAKCDARAFDVIVRGLALYLTLRANFDPSQPRVPSGQPGGGRWTDGGAEVILAQGPSKTGEGSSNQRYLIDLRDHEGKDGAHTIARHVGKSDAYLINRMNTERRPGFNWSLALRRAGTFLSLPGANRLISATLYRNRDIVDRVASGEVSSDFVTAEFPYPTGREFYREPSTWRIFTSDPMRFRLTYGVGVAIEHNPEMPKGFFD